MTTLTPSPIRTCERCGLAYDFRRSPSSLRLTYCGSLCEVAATGTTIEALLHARRKEVIS